MFTQSNNWPAYNLRNPTNNARITANPGVFILRASIDQNTLEKGFRNAVAEPHIRFGILRKPLRYKHGGTPTWICNPRSAVMAYSYSGSGSWHLVIALMPRKSILQIMVNLRHRKPKLCRLFLYRLHIYIYSIFIYSFMYLNSHIFKYTLVKNVKNMNTYIYYICIYTSSTAQGGGGRWRKFQR